MNSIIIISLVLYPFQVFSRYLFGPLNEIAAIDLTSLVLIAMCFSFFLINLKKSHDWLFLLLYISYEAVIYFFLGTQPILRFFYILLITSGLILVAIYAQKIKLSLSQVFYSILTVNLISALYIFYQSLHSELSIRPSALFMEPSYAGLSLYSVVSGLIGVFLFCNKESFSITAYLGSIALLMVAGILTLSFHFVALFISVSLFIILRLASSKHYHVGYLLGSPILFVFIIFTVREFDFFVAHFNSRINHDPSMETWLLGWEQMINSLSISPLWGQGVGSTGYFEGEHSEFKAINHNHYDAYSLMFRMVIEFGLFPVLFLLYFIFQQVRQFFQYLQLNNKAGCSPDLYFIFIFIFSFTVIVGSLLKEPSYGRSTLFVAVFLFFYAKSFMLSKLNPS